MSTARILIVDDNPVNLKLAASVLEFAGWQVLEASDATQALAVIRDTPPDLILMDIALPGMDGLTLTRQLKADQATRHIGVVALTAFAMRGDDQKAKEAGCDGYITKPIDTRKLPVQVAEILGRLNGTKEGAVSFSLSSTPVEERGRGEEASSKCPPLPDPLPATRGEGVMPTTSDSESPTERHP